MPPLARFSLEAVGAVSARSVQEPDVGSPITFSGFNSIDFNMILNAVMAQERVPLTRLETRKSTLETQNSQFGTLAGRLSTLESAVEALKEKDSLAFLSASSSDSGVGVTATTGSVTGTYDIVVTELARSQVTSSSSTYGAATDVVATSGTVTLTPANGDPATVITLTGSTTLQGLADLINAEDGAPAAASVVQTSPGVYKLLLTGKETGSTNAFTITRSLAGGAGLAFTDTDGDSIFGDSAADNTQNAINAAFTVNGLSVSSASNSVSDVISGVTLSLLRKDPATTATVKVDRDETKAKDLIKKFITAYNDITTFAKDQLTASIAGRPSIGRDPLLKSLRETLRNATMDEYTGGTLTRLAEIGVGFDPTGKMILDEEQFESVMASAPAAVQQLVSGTAGDGGAFGEFATIIAGYTEAGGLVSSMRERIDEQVSSLSKRLDGMEAQLELRRLALQREYIAADLAMTRLKSQSASLSSMGGGYKLF
jgi:flagellar hook-associated protein 2